MTPNEVNQLIDEKLKVLLGAYVVSDNKLTLKKSIEVVSPNTISPAGGTVYSGTVSSSGTIYGPTGWTCSKSGTGDYTVNKGFPSYSFGEFAIVASADSSCYVNVQLFGTTFRLLALNAAGVATDANINFLAMEI